MHEKLTRQARSHFDQAETGFEQVEIGLPHKIVETKAGHNPGEVTLDHNHVVVVAVRNFVALVVVLVEHMEAVDMSV